MKKWLSILMALSIGLATLTFTGCDQTKDAADETGDAIEEGVEETGEAVENAADKLD